MPRADSSAPLERATDSAVAPGRFEGPEADLTEALRRCCVEILADYGVAAMPNADRAQKSSLSVYAAVAGFSSDVLRGSVGLTASRGVLTRTGGPSVERDPSPLLDDWTCELVNQLLGRFKNKLRAFDVVVDAQHPSTLGLDRMSELDRGARFRFSSDYGEFSGYLELELAAGLVLQRRELGESLPGEGDLILF